MLQITLNIIITIPQDIAAVAGFEDRTAKATAAAIRLKIIQSATGANSPRLQLHFPSVWKKREKKILSSCLRLFWSTGCVDYPRRVPQNISRPKCNFSEGTGSGRETNWNTSRALICLKFRTSSWRGHSIRATATRGWIKLDVPRGVWLKTFGTTLPICRIVSCCVNLLSLIFPALTFPFTLIVDLPFFYFLFFLHFWQ